MPYILKKYYPLRNVIFVLGEGAIIFLTIASVNYLGAGAAQVESELALYCFRAMVVTLAFQVCLYYFDLYDLSIIPSLSDSLTRILQAFGFGCIALSFLYFLFPLLIISTKVFWAGFLAVCLAICVWRFFYFGMLERKMFTQPIAILGTGELAAKIVAAIEGKKDSGFKIVAFVGKAPPEKMSNGAPVFADAKSLLPLCVARTVEKIVLAPDERRGQLPMNELIRYKFMGIDIVDGVGFYEEIAARMPVEKVNPSWLLFSDGFHVGRLTRFVKRALDICASSVGLLFSLPIFLVSALIIKLESPGPVFYCQERVGERGVLFKVIKFRSMRNDAEKDGPVWAQQNDSRVTRYGEIMRKLRIDEIPQMLNVLMGDMSFVGPRPERLFFVKDLEEKIPYYSIRHVVKPGITGWAQVYYPYGASEEDALRKLEYDLYYIKNLSIGMDLWTIFQTVKVVLFRKGSR
ncbi:TIGR03013 family XrtA/PEP-CTERM system glycosyltransferase [Thiovibrio sp. JS02]